MEVAANDFTVQPDLTLAINAIEQHFDRSICGHTIQAEMLAVPTLSAERVAGVLTADSFLVERAALVWCCAAGNVFNRPVVRQIDLAPAAVSERCRLKPISGPALKQPAIVERLTTPHSGRS